MASKLSLSCESSYANWRKAKAKVGFRSREGANVSCQNQNIEYHRLTEVHYQLKIMSRKSARLHGKRKNDNDEITITMSRKRKADEMEEEECEKNDAVMKKRQMRIQNHFVPISQHSSIASTVIVPVSSPKSEKENPEMVHNRTPQESLMTSSFRFQNFFTTPIAHRESPLPSLQWADSTEVWQLMLEKETHYSRDSAFLNRHSNLQSRMRSILLDWLIEVCEVYRLHRETFYLAVDFVDRYLSITRNIQKQVLQLIGISALFIAAKLEEIYPPKLAEFSYVTDGACTESEILDQELVMLKALKWDLCPMTANSWLNVFLQLVNLENNNEEKDQELQDANFVMPAYSPHAFIQIARLLDLCHLDIGCLQFNYSILAASAIYHMSSADVALSVSGYKWIDIAPCVQWMAPFAMTLREAGPQELKFFNQINQEDTHNIQTHCVDLDLLEKAQNRQLALDQSSRASPDHVKSDYPGIITPPCSKGKNKSLSPQ